MLESEVPMRHFPPDPFAIPPAPQPETWEDLVSQEKWDDIDTLLENPALSTAYRDAVLRDVLRLLVQEGSKEKWGTLQNYVEQAEGSREEERLGAGVQYTVLRKGEDRVLKVPTSRLQKALTLRSWGVSDEQAMYESILSVEQLTSHSIEGLKAAGIGSEYSLLGHPAFGEGLDYEQDLIVPLNKYFEAHSLEENKEKIDLFIQSILATWRRGFSDVTFNFDVNGGVTEDGEVIIADIGELAFSKEEVAVLIREKKWLSQYSYTRLPNADLKEYFRIQMDKFVTLENLERNWGTDLERREV